MSKFSDFLQLQLRAVRGVKPQEESLPVQSNTEHIDLDQNVMTVAQNLSNQLEVDLGLREKTAIECFEENTSEKTLRNISKRDQTPDMVRIAIEADGTAIKSISKKLITYELCKIAVIQNGLSLRDIPENQVTDEIIELAVKNKGTAIALVPKQKITKQLAMLAVCQPIMIGRHDFYKYPIYYVPESLLDEQLVTQSVNYSPRSIQHVPKKYITKELLYRETDRVSSLSSQAENSSECMI